MTSKLIRVPDFELRRTLFAEIYQRFSEPKSQRKAFLLMETAIECVARKGYDGVTAEMIARASGVSRPLIKYYFGSLPELLRISTQYIRLLFQQMAVEALLGGTDPADGLDRYVAACLLWTEAYRTNARVWFRFLLDGARSKEGRALNTAAVARGEERLTMLLERGREAGIFHFDDLSTAAKMVQTMITGAIITYGCENLTDPVAYAAQVQRSCRRLLGVRENHLPQCRRNSSLSS